MKVKLNRDEVEEAIRRYIKSEYLSDYHKYKFGEVDIESFNIKEDFYVKVDCKKSLDASPVQPPTPPKMY